MMTLCRILVAAAALTWSPRPAFAESAASALGRAQVAFQRRDDRAALKILQSLLRRDPNYQPARFLLGRIYYRAGDVGRAAQQFKRVNPDLVPAAAAYEYGISLFEAKSCGRAILGFQKVPAADELRGLADFYIGICAAQRHDWEMARNYLQGAAGLPPYLESVRRQALIRLRSALRAERRGSVAAPPPFAFMPSAPPPVTPAPMPEATPVAPPKAAPPVVKAPAAGLIVTSVFGGTTTETNTKTDYFGYKTEEAESSGWTTTANLKARYNGETTSSGGGSYTSLDVDLARNFSSGGGASVAYVTNPSAPGEIREQPAALPSAKSHTVDVKFKPEVGLPLGADVQVAGSYSHAETYADLGMEKKNVTAGPSATIDGSSGTLSGKLTASQTILTFFNKTNTITNNTIGGEVTKSFIGGASVSLDVTQQDILGSHPVDAVKGATSDGTFTYEGAIMVVGFDAAKSWKTFSLNLGITRTSLEPGDPNGFYTLGGVERLLIELSASKTLDIGGSFAVTVSNKQVSQFQAEVEDQSKPRDADGKYPLGFVKTDGTVQSVSVALKLAPVDWLFGLASYKYTKQAFTLSDTKLQQGFETTTPETIIESTLQAGVTKSF